MLKARVSKHYLWTRDQGGIEMIPWCGTRLIGEQGLLWGGQAHIKGHIPYAIVQLPYLLFDN